MTHLDPLYAESRFRLLSTAELEDILAKNVDEYSDAALDIARRELEKRHTSSEPQGKSEVASEPPPAPHRKTTWLEVYPALLGTGAIGGGVAIVIFAPVADYGFLLFNALCLAVAVGLIKRREWAWYANFAVLLFALIGPMMGSSAFLAVARLVWFVINVRYFWKRRELFS